MQYTIDTIRLLFWLDFFKKISLSFFFVILLVSHTSALYSAEDKLGIVYSRGFAEPNDYKEGPAYPDAPLPGDWWPVRWYMARFCTKEPVHALANYLKQKVVDEDCNRIYLNCLSCGSGTALNCLYKLIHYTKDPAYFQGTPITSDDAQNIIAAINKGGIRLDLPFLSVKKTVPVAVAAYILTLLTYKGFIYWFYRSGIFHQAIGIKNNRLADVVGSVLFTVLYFKNGFRVKNLYSTLIDFLLVPPLTLFHYNPFHLKPIDAVEGLRGKITCPVLIQCSTDDRLLVNPDEDTVKMYDAFRDAGNETNVYIFLSGAHTHFNYFNDSMHQTIANNFEACICNRTLMSDYTYLQPSIVKLCLHYDFNVQNK